MWPHFDDFIKRWTGEAALQSDNPGADQRWSDICVSWRAPSTVGDVADGGE
jgi:hypothetical protein